MRLHIVWTTQHPEPCCADNWWPTFVVDEQSLDEAPEENQEAMAEAVRKAEEHGIARVVVIDVPSDALYAQLTKEPDAIPAEVQP